MIVVRVEYHRAGSGQVETIGTAIISNDGTGTAQRGNYDVRVGRRRSVSLVDTHTHPVRRGRVLDFPRRSYPVWRLIARALRAAFPEEK